MSADKGDNFPHLGKPLGRTPYLTVSPKAGSVLTSRTRSAARIASIFQKQNLYNDGSEPCFDIELVAVSSRR